MKARQAVVRQLMWMLTSFVGATAPAIGWAAPLEDQPLFLKSNVDHNLLFVVDDSGSMDWEVLAPAVGGEGAITSGYLFNVGDAPSGDYNGQRIDNSTTYSYSRRYYYLRSSEYNYTYYDPSVAYKPWPKGDNTNYSEFGATAAPLDPHYTGITYNLTKADSFGYVPAVFFKRTTTGSVTGPIPKYGSCSSGFSSYTESQCRKQSCFFGFCWYEYEEKPVVYETKTASCTSTNSSWYAALRQKPSEFTFTAPAESLAPDGACLNRVDLSVDNPEISAVTGQSWATQLQNFSNWFTYYRRRHQAIRGAVGEAVKDLENMRLGMFWLHETTKPTMYSATTQRTDFLVNHYEHNDGWDGGGTPLRKALNLAGRYYADETVRGELACRKNYTLLFTDGEANDHSASGYSGNADGVDGVPAVYKNADHSNTLADIAYYYYQQLRDASGNAVSGGALSVPDECGTSSQDAWLDCNSKHHMNTFTIGLGMVGQKFAGRTVGSVTYDNVRAAYTQNPNWNSVTGLNSDGGADEIDDLYHAAVNGRGEFYNAKSTDTLSKALKAAVDRATSEAQGGSNVSFNTGTLEAGAHIYSAQFKPGVWTGTVQAETLTEEGKIGTVVWDAADKLDARDLATKPRTILTYHATDKAGKAFQWSKLDSNQLADLKKDVTDSVAQARLAYLRGDTSEENKSFRDRLSRLGDIINSAPVYAGKPAMKWPDKAPFGKPNDNYGKFRAEKAERTPMIYVGANDGMLHGFDASTGEERLAYVPNFLSSTAAGKGLNYLTSKSYRHASYVDLPLAISDIYTNNAWRTVLIGGGRSGGRGLFALDITNPSSFNETDTAAAQTVLWEFSAADAGNDLGYMIEAPVITLLKWGNNDLRWSAVFSNGYGAPSGRNGVFVLDIAGGADGWVAGTDFKFIDLAAGGGLSPVRVVDHLVSDGSAGSDGIADRIYAGDLEGRLWAVKLTDGKSSWSSAYGTKPLFTAKNASNQVQPITAAPIVEYNSYHKEHQSPNLLVFFGTGKYLSKDDVAADSTEVQSFYGVNDRYVSDLNREAHLVERALIQETKGAAPNQYEVRKTGEAELDWTADFGWYIDFDIATETGERVVSGALVRNGYVVFNTLTPKTDTSCAGGGSSWLMIVGLDGSTSTSAILDVNRDGQVDSDDAGLSGARHGDAILLNVAFIGDTVFGAASNAKKPSFKTKLGGGVAGTGRLSWRELMLE